MKSNNGTITIAFKGGCFLLVAPVVPCCTRYAHEKILRKRVSKLDWCPSKLAIEIVEIALMNPILIFKHPSFLVPIMWNFSTKPWWIKNFPVHKLSLGCQLQRSAWVHPSGLLKDQRPGEELPSWPRGYAPQINKWLWTSEQVVWLIMNNKH